MSNYIYKRCNSTADYQNAVNLLYTVRDELKLPDHEACKQVANLCMGKGGVLLSYDKKKVCALTGYFYGDPNEDFQDKSVGFFYVAAVLPEYRLTRIFYEGLKYTLNTVKQGGATQIRMQAAKEDPYTNRLYSRFANPLKEGKTLRGKPVMTYGNDIEAALAYFERRRPGTRPVNCGVGTA